MKDAVLAKRIAVRKAFQALVAACMQHRAVWCTQAISNQAMSHLINAVELLAAADHMDDGYIPSYTPRDRDAEARSRLSRHLIGIFKKVETRLRWQQGVPDVESLLAMRAHFPDEKHALAEFAQQVLDTLTEDPALFERFGIRAQLHVWLRDALVAYRLQNDAPPRPVIQYAGNMSTYDRLLNNCIRHLLERVDPVMTRYPKSDPFPVHYRKCRKKMEKLDVDARLTYHVDGVGSVSERHRDAKKPWPVNLGAQDQLGREA